MVNNIDTEADVMQNSEYQPFNGSSGDPNVMTNPALFTSHANLSNNEIPLDRSIYSDTMLTHTMDQLNIMGMSQGL